jgi:hypothetical protein
MPYIGNAPYQGIVAGTNIQDGTVDTPDIKDGAVTSAKLNNITTTSISEGTNQYFTQARARSSISVTGSAAYDSATGVITVSGDVSTAKLKQISWFNG